jgi:hypothetical protein
VRVPNLVGQSEKNVDRILHKYGLRLGKPIGTMAGGPLGTVTDQFPPADSLVPVGSWVNVSFVVPASQRGQETSGWESLLAGLRAAPRSWWLAAAALLTAAMAAAGGIRHARRRTRVPRLKATLAPGSLGWSDSAPPADASVACEVRLRVRLDLTDDGRASQ